MLVRLKGNEFVGSVYTKIRNRRFGKQSSLGAGTAGDPGLPGTGSNSPGHKGVTGRTEVLASNPGLRRRLLAGRPPQAPGDPGRQSRWTVRAAWVTRPRSPTQEATVLEVATSAEM